MSQNSLITVIPARGGSKGIPDKNLQQINGLTLVDRAIISAKKILENRIIVSSNDDRILDIANNHDVEIHKRSDINSTDSASSESVILEVLRDFEIRDVLVTLLQATSPFIDVKIWLESVKKMKIDQKLGSIFSAVQKNDFYWELREKWEPVNHDKRERLPRQNRLLGASETGAFYIFRSDLFEIEHTRFCGITEPALTAQWSNFDIDSMEDLEFCRFLSKMLDLKYLG